jgi:DNA-directed RNA polymerase delta subunit
MRCQFSGKNLDDGDISLDGRVVSMNDTFWYLRSMLQSEGEIDKDVSHILRDGWVKWRQAYDVLCDKKCRDSECSNPINAQATERP